MYCHLLTQYYYCHHPSHGRHHRSDDQSQERAETQARSSVRSWGSGDQVSLHTASVWDQVWPQDSQQIHEEVRGHMPSKHRSCNFAGKSRSSVKMSWRSLLKKSTKSLRDLRDKVGNHSLGEDSYWSLLLLVKLDISWCLLTCYTLFFSACMIGVVPSFALMIYYSWDEELAVIREPGV